MSAFVCTTRDVENRYPMTRPLISDFNDYSSSQSELSLLLYWQCTESINLCGQIKVNAANNARARNQIYSKNGRNGFDKIRSVSREGTNFRSALQHRQGQSLFFSQAMNAFTKLSKKREMKLRSPLWLVHHNKSFRMPTTAYKRNIIICQQNSLKHTAFPPQNNILIARLRSSQERMVLLENVSNTAAVIYHSLSPTFLIKIRDKRFTM